MRPDDLRKALLETKAQIVHFCGHGSGKNGLVLENEQGEAKSISTQALANLFKLFSGQIKCVVLNACYSEEQAEAIVQHVGYVIGMNEAIGDEAAIKFSIGFYDALGAQRSIKDAFDFGCNSIEIEGIAEYLALVLKLNNDNVDILEKNQQLSNLSSVQDSWVLCMILMFPLIIIKRSEMFVWLNSNRRFLVPFELLLGHKCSVAFEAIFPL